MLICFLRFGNFNFVLFSIAVGYMLCPSQLTAQPGALDIWKLALQDGYCVMLFRDEVMMVHKEFTTVFDGMKGKENSKRKRDIEESLNYAMMNRLVRL